ncbi:MAG: YdcH family protein [Aquificaceae bacterium]|nr:YdcH family protein [Aquificaceae bacterium]MCX8075821.1 YdcH family protein [Aquificaceae bacterium]MDW8095268.1 YdcH family protein [Aquificaceae bacterium]MDW8433346.1 YdcH family protein [Aquificaceae bacterium]
MTREELIQKLLQENKEFRYHYEKHHELDVTIQKMEKHHPMTHELEMEIERLKREKLYHKDMMEYIIKEHSKAQV